MMVIMMTMVVVVVTVVPVVVPHANVYQNPKFIQSESTHEDAAGC